MQQAWSHSLHHPRHPLHRHHHSHHHHHHHCHHCLDDDYSLKVEVPRGFYPLERGLQWPYRPTLAWETEIILSFMIMVLCNRWLLANTGVSNDKRTVFEEVLTKVKWRMLSDWRLWWFCCFQRGELSWKAKFIKCWFRKPPPRGIRAET